MDELNPFASPQSSGSGPEADQPGPSEAVDGAVDMVKVASYTNISEAHLCQSILRQVDIESYLENEAAVGANLLWSNAVGGIKVFVSSADAEKAAGMLSGIAEQLENAKNLAPITFRCEECDAEITFPGERRGHVETCPKCHDYIDVPD